MPDIPHHVNIAPDFLRQLQADPDATVAAIIRYRRLGADEEAQLAALGLLLRRRLRLIRGLAVEGPARALLALGTAAWVERIEPDLPVHTTPTEVLS